jgi:hypothetical protein
MNAVAKALKVIAWVVCGLLVLLPLSPVIALMWTVKLLHEGKPALAKARRRSACSTRSWFQAAHI